MPSTYSWIEIDRIRKQCLPYTLPSVMRDKLRSIEQNLTNIPSNETKYHYTDYSLPEIWKPPMPVFVSKMEQGSEGQAEDPIKKLVGQWRLALNKCTDDWTVPYQVMVTSLHAYIEQEKKDPEVNKQQDQTTQKLEIADNWDEEEQNQNQTQDQEKHEENKDIIPESVIQVFWNTLHSLKTNHETFANLYLNLTKEWPELDVALLQLWKQTYTKLDLNDNNSMQIPNSNTDYDAYCNWTKHTNATLSNLLFLGYCAKEKEYLSFVECVQQIISMCNKLTQQPNKVEIIEYYMDIFLKLYKVINQLNLVVDTTTNEILQQMCQYDMNSSTCKKYVSWSHKLKYKLESRNFVPTNT